MFHGTIGMIGSAVSYRGKIGTIVPRYDRYDLYYLEVINQIRRYREEGKTPAEVTDACLDSLDRHQWYLDPTLVIFALDDGLPITQ